jgi:hypothetical protein
VPATVAGSTQLCEGLGIQAVRRHAVVQAHAAGLEALGPTGLSAFAELGRAGVLIVLLRTYW